MTTLYVGQGLALVTFAGGEYGFKHVCGSWADDREPDGTFSKVVAPRLSAHVVTGSGPDITVSPSILCTACGLHGFLRDGRWAPVP